MDNYIENINRNICRNIESNADDRGFMSQNILSQLRNLVDHICVKIYLDEGGCRENNEYRNIQNAKSYIKKNGKLQFLVRFHELLLVSASHYTFDPDSSERLMLKYYEYLLRTKDLMKLYGIDILENLNKFPLDTDPAFNEYYDAIASKIDSIDLSNLSTYEHRFCIEKVKPLFIKGKIYYEVSFSPSNDKVSKFDRIIAFTNIELSTYYTNLLRLVTVNIIVDGMVMPVNLIVDSRVSIRPCELRNFSKIFDDPISVSKNREYINLMDYLQNTLLSLPEVMDFNNSDFIEFIKYINSGAKTNQISNLLMTCRNHIRCNKGGGNVVRYLLLRLNNKMIKKQLYDIPIFILGNLYLNPKCKPFDKLPYFFSLVEHNPRMSDLLLSISPEGHEGELLARCIRHLTEQEGKLYSRYDELASFGSVDDISQLIDCYNKSLHRNHQRCAIGEYNGNYFIKGYEDDVCKIMEQLNNLTKTGVANYSDDVDDWLASSNVDTRAVSKEVELKSIFKDSRLSLIYGAAGTGKSTFINFLSLIFSGNKKLYLANTHPAVDNLCRKINAPNVEFSTISKYLSYNSLQFNRDIIFIDECSTVSNRDMREILERSKFNLLVLVGDVYQIEAISFGNWFNIANKAFAFPVKIELKDVYRTTRPELLNVWDRVRDKSVDITEFLAKGNFSRRFDRSIFDGDGDDEIILSLNYGGLYGINNINRFLQNNNPNTSVIWGVHTYKVGDPVLFNDTKRFPELYNNLKGRIIKIDIDENQIVFTLEVNTVIDSTYVKNSELLVLESDNIGKSIVRFNVDKASDNDDDVDDERGMVPFQIAYAVSIHKAQGLEYNSVKVVITQDIEDQISHNIFYTAITRACNKLLIYWSPETEHKIISTIIKKSDFKDFGLLKSKHPELF